MIIDVRQHGHEILEHRQTNIIMNDHNSGPVLTIKCLNSIIFYLSIMVTNRFIGHVKNYLDTYKTHFQHRVPDNWKLL